MSKSEETGALRTRAVSGGKWSSVSAVLCVGAQTLQLAILGRLLGPEDFGVMAIMMVVIGLATSISDFGFGNYIIQADSISQPIFTRFCMICGQLSVVLIVAIYFLTPIISKLSGIPQVTVFLPWLGPVVLITTIAQIATAVLQRELMFANLAITEIIAAFVSVMVSIVVAYKGYGLWALILGQLVNSWIRSSILIVYAIPIITKYTQQGDTNAAGLNRFCAYQTGERLFNFFSVNIDKILIGKFLGEHALGVYSVAFQLILRPLVAINPVFNRVALPMFSKIKNDNSRLARGYIELSRTIGLIIFPTYMILCICAPTVVSVLLGDKWHDAEPVLSILAFLGIQFALGNPIGNLIIAKGKTDWSLFLNIFSVGIYFMVVYIGCQINLMWVAGLMVVASWIIIFPIQLYLKYKLILLRPIRYIAALKFHIISTLIPCLVVGIFSIYGIQVNQINIAILIGVLSLVFFYVSMYIAERLLVVRSIALFGFSKSME